MNSILLRSTFRARQTSSLAAACRGGFHKPDPVPYAKYQHTRRIHLEDINTQFYSDIGPEFYMHLHSLQIQNGRRGWFLLLAYFTLIIFPAWSIAAKCHRDMGSILFPAVRPGKDHAHMAPKLLTHLNANNFENKPDWLGRRNA